MKVQKECDKENKINFIIPDFLNAPGCVYLLDTFRSHKEIFKDNIDIIGLHGMFVGNSWNIKDKKFDMYMMDYDLLNKIKFKYNNEYNISLFISFDKEDISVNDLEDEYSNTVMKIFDDKKNYVICKSDKLADYIKETYKNVNVVKEYKERTEDCSYMIVDPKLNRNEKMLNFKNKEKLILIPDGGFIPNRRNLFNHTKKDSVLNHINPKKDKYYTKSDVCSFMEAKQRDEYLNFKDLAKYSKKGINTFMLSGIGVFNIAMYENLLEFVLKEEYRMDNRIVINRKLLALLEQKQNAIYKYEL